MAYINDLVANCLQFENAFCSAECPFELDVRDFVGKLQQGRINVAYKTYQYTVGFPGIVTALCGEPCSNVCPLKDHGGSISLKLLELASIEHARSRIPDQYNMPPKEPRIAVIGAGISGLACALRLTTKKYNVTIYEKTEKIGGHLYDLLPPEIFLEDIKLQFTHENYDLKLNHEITSLDELDFDAVYVSTGKGGNKFGLDLISIENFATSRTGVFMGGSVTGVDTMHAISHGLQVSSVIEKYLKTGQMVHASDFGKGTKLPYDVIRIKKSEKVLPDNSKSYSKEEALREAGRCLKCSCDACVHYSPLMNYFKKFPKRITEEVEITITPSTLDGAGTVATRLISTCNHCGLCKEVCPVDIDAGEFLLKSHKTMRAKGAMPWAFHEFYLRDMEFTNTEASLIRIPRDKEKCEYFFFPGCQMGASDPGYVTESYRFLLQYLPGTAIMLHCCGAPADWAGDEPIHNDVIEKIRKEWFKLGKPRAIFGCTMCRQMFQKYLPEIEGDFLYNIIYKNLPSGSKTYVDKKASVFDPCASRYEDKLQSTIRDLATSAGYILEPLPMEGKMAECCSYGGQVAIAHPPYTENLIKKDISMSENPYITYCTNCKDIFLASGKPANHILDIVFNLEKKDVKPPTVSERRENRIRLKKDVIREFWNEIIDMEKSKIIFHISDELKDKLNRNKILESDLFEVINYSEESGIKIKDDTKNCFIAYNQIGNMTYWVEYRIMDNENIEIINGYCHRMKIED